MISDSNPINRCFDVERPLFSEKDITDARRKLEDLIQAFKSGVSGSTEHRATSLARGLQIFASRGVRKDETAPQLFVSSLNGNIINCNGYAYTLMAAAHEMDWSVALRTASDHIWVYCDNFNVDWENTKDDNSMERTYGPFTTHNTDDTIQAIFLLNRGHDWTHNAPADYEAALNLNPNLVSVRSCLGAFYCNHKLDYQKGLGFYNQEQEFQNGFRSRLLLSNIAEAKAKLIRARLLDEKRKPLENELADVEKDCDESEKSFQALDSSIEESIKKQNGETRRIAQDLREGIQ